MLETFWDIAFCSLVEADRRFRGAYYLRYQGETVTLFMEAVSISETSV
jgi:hypothetical protein